MANPIKRLLEDHDPNTMTVRDLIAFLQQYEEDMPVYYSHPAHDHWHTELAGAVNGGEEQQVEYSDYHNQNVVKGEDDEDGEPTDERSSGEEAPLHEPGMQAGSRALILTPHG
jgi:hypothetical protein